MEVEGILGDDVPVEGHTAGLDDVAATMTWRERVSIMLRHAIYAFLVKLVSLVGLENTSTKSDILVGMLSSHIALGNFTS